MMKLEEAFVSGKWTPFCDDGTPDIGQHGSEPVAQDQPTTAATKQGKCPGTTPRWKSGVKRRNSKLCSNVVKKKKTANHKRTCMVIQSNLDYPN